MPAATAPLGKPTASKPTTGFTKPAGLSRQTASGTSTKETTTVDEEEENTGLQPIHLGVSIVAALLAALFLFTTYTGDQTPNRVSDYLFGKPSAGDVSADYTSASDDEDSSSSASDSEDEEDEEDEGDDE